MNAAATGGARRSALIPRDVAVRERIAASVDTSLCVEAGAGTGKTTVLVERIVEVLRSGRATVDQLAVITFAEKAAAELAVRVRERLEELATDADTPTDQQQRLRQATRDLYRARIETIHAFAANLLRERPAEAGLDPEFAVLDGLAGGLAFDEAFEAWQAKLLGEDHPEIVRALNRGFTLKHLRETAEALNHHRYVLPLAPVGQSRPDPAGFAFRLEQRCRELEQLLEHCERPDEDLGAQQLPLVLELGERVAEAFAAAASGEAVSDATASGEAVSGAASGEAPALERTLLFNAPVLKPGIGSQKNWPGAKDSCRRMKAIVKELKTDIATTQEQLRSDALMGVMPFIESFVQSFEQTRRRGGRADFDDLLIWARNLLRDDPGVRRYFQRRYRAILVDEFQDTDPIQAELVIYLAADEEVETGDWRTLQPAPGKLFVVGDPKQSIYRFRRADIAVYDQVKRGVLADGQYSISQSFRATRGLIDWVNRAFDTVFVEQEGVQPANVPLDPAAPPIAELERAPVVVVNRPARADGEALESAPERREEEARLLARLLRRAVDDEHWPVRDRGSGEVRRACWRDAAILVPARTGLDAYETALADAGVPFRHEGGRTFFARQEVRELVACLRAVDDPTDRLNLVSTLRSPAFGCSDEEIFLFTTEGGALDYRVPGQDGPESVRDGLEKLRDLHHLRGRVSLPELMRRLLERTGTIELALSLPDGSQAAANVVKVIEQARGFSSSGGGGLRAFARWLSESSESAADESDAWISEDSDNVVRLLTVHGAKGLEFPIVALANFAGDTDKQTRPIPDTAGHCLDLRVGTEHPGWFKTPGFEHANAKEKEMSAAEVRRLLYVAATRARDHLVIPVVGDRAKMKGRIEALLDHLPEGAPRAAADGSGGDARSAADGEGLGNGDDDATGCFVYDPAALDAEPERASEPAAPHDAEAVDAALERKQEWEQERERTLARARRELPILTATGIEKPWRPVSLAAESLDGAVNAGEGPPLPIGDALHRVLELVRLPGAEDLEPLTRAVCAEAGLEPRLDELLAMARNGLASPVMQRALASSSLHREVAFTVAAGSGRDDGFYTGRVDLVFSERRESGSDALVVVDFKSDQVGVPDGASTGGADHATEGGTDDGTNDRAAAVSAHAQQHLPQAASYARAVAEATGLPVAEVVLVFARSGVEHKFTVDAELLAAAPPVAAPTTAAAA